jgi:uncharacterized membrane protein YvbJ
MTCPHCGSDAPAGMNFCGACGQRLTPGCPACGFENLPGFKFCGQCGASLTQLPHLGSRFNFFRTSRE